MKTIEVHVSGISCGGCVRKITEHFEQVQSVVSTEVSLDEQIVKLSGSEDLSNMKIRNDLIELGFTVNSIKKA